MFECSICFRTITNSCIGSCNHHFCYNCLLKWITIKQMKNNVIASCPKCRTMINEIRLDPEFDSIISVFNNNLLTIDKTEYEDDIFYNEQYIINKANDSGSESDNSNIDDNIEKILYINFKIESDYFGIVLQNNNKGPGVIISNVKCNSIGEKHGLKKNDILLFVNNMPCFTSDYTSDLLTTLIKKKATIKINLIPFIKKTNPPMLNNFCIFGIFNRVRISAEISAEI